MDYKALIGALALFIASPSWATSCYLGGHDGMSATVTETSLDAAAPLPVTANILTINGLGSSGTLAGLHAGCDVKIQQFVIGAFGDYAWHNEKLEFSSGLPGGGVLAAVDVNSRWTIGGRAGIMFDKTLVYGLFGYSKMSTGDINVPIAAITLALPTFEGWVMGGGIETEIAKNIRIGVEYRRARYDAQDLALPIAGLSLGMQPEMHTATARLSYVFDFSGK